MRHARTQAAAIALKLLFPLVMGAAFFGAVYLRFYSGLIAVRDLPSWPAYTAYFVLSLALWSVLETRHGLADSLAGETAFGHWRWKLIRLSLLTFALVSVAAFLWRGYSFSRLAVMMFWALHTLLCLGSAWMVRRRLLRGNQGGVVWVLLVGRGARVEELERACLPPGAPPVSERFATAAEALAALERREPPAGCQEIWVAAREPLPLAEIADALARQPVPASIALGGLPFGAVGCAGSFLVFSAGPAASEEFDYVFLKRALDLALSALLAVLLLPVMAMIAAVVFLRSGKPVLLKQERVGRGGRRFHLYKFRTLPVSSLPASDRQWTVDPDDAWGRFLRRTGLDELPQLLNVLRGEMSLVGPRPERPHFVEQFRRQLPLYGTRHRFQAGITGWAQVHGWRGNTSISRRVEHDLYYLRHWSLALDLRILWMTLKNFGCQIRDSQAPVDVATNAGSV